MAYNPNGEDEELGYDSHVPFVQHVFSDVDTHIDRIEDGPEEGNGGSTVKECAMSEGMRAKYPGVVSALFTMADGRQVRFHR